MGEGVCCRGEACVAGGRHAWQGGMRGGGCAWQGGVRARGACMAGVHGRGVCMAGRTAIAAGGTHPTGMHSCCYCTQKNSPHANWLQIGEHSDLVHLVLFGAESTYKV